MPGITLTEEEVRSAPPEVRGWIEDKVAAMWGEPRATGAHPAARTLAICAADEAHAILAQIQSLLPVVSVFFELGRAGPVAGDQPVRVFALAEIQRYAHLRAPEQVLQCLDVINQVFRESRGDAKASLCAADEDGHCYVAEATSRTIRTLWHEIVAERAFQGDDAEPSVQSRAM